MLKIERTFKMSKKLFHLVQTAVGYTLVECTIPTITNATIADLTAQALQEKTIGCRWITVSPPRTEAGHAKALRVELAQPHPEDETDALSYMRIESFIRKLEG